MSGRAKVFPVIIVALGALWLLQKAMPVDEPDDGMAIHEFGRIPVVYQGRVKPLDTLARNTMRVISDRQVFYDNSKSDPKGEQRPAIRWLLDVMTSADAAREYKVFRIVNLEVLETLGLQPRLKPTSKKYRYSVDEIASGLPALHEQYSKAAHLAEQDSDLLDVYQRHILKLGNHWQLYARLHNRAIPLSVPPRSPQEQWTSFVQATAHVNHGGTLDPVAASFNNILNAYTDHDATAFKHYVLEHLANIGQILGRAQMAKAVFEVFFNRFAPFYHCAALYLITFVLSAIAWLVWAKPLTRAAFWLMALTFIVHTFALVGRIYISGRPPVTNLYSSATFIGWGCVVLGLVLELIFRLGIGNIVASVTGFMTLVIAHNLAGDGDTFEMLQAVLDTQFWLATHVTCVTLGYSTTFLAGFLGLVYVLRGLFTRSLSKPLSTDLARMIYGILCFALFFSFIGTVLGGLWADDSWGRFWGWDPKENGALMIVLWNALILHARWGGMVKARGMALLAIFGNIVTSWSWFGTNELGVGLHSYGFTEGRAFWLLLFVASQLFIMAIGILPQRLWRSFAVPQNQKAARGDLPLANSVES